MYLGWAIKSNFSLKLFITFSVLSLKISKFSNFREKILGKNGVN